MAACNFNPRSLVGNDEGGGFAPLKKVISIHVPSWGTTGDFARTSGSWAFQSTFPRGERLARLGKFGWTALFQSTFPRGERRILPIIFLITISIHVPSWGTTISKVNGVVSAIISIHVPSWGTTICGQKLQQESIFQSTFPRGERRDILLQHRNFQTISIHVPSWGTTFGAMSKSFGFSISIHVPSWGTTISVYIWQFPRAFQSTFPRGERQSSLRV